MDLWVGMDLMDEPRRVALESSAGHDHAAGAKSRTLAAGPAPETMRASRSRTRKHTNLLTATPDEAALAIACFLSTARDLLCLQLACRRFSIKSFRSH